MNFARDEVRLLLRTRMPRSGTTGFCPLHLRTLPSVPAICIRSFQFAIPFGLAFSHSIVDCCPMTLHGHEIYSFTDIQPSPRNASLHKRRLLRGFLSNARRAICALLSIAVSCLCYAQQPPAPDTNSPAPLTLTTTQDHQLMMDALHITSLRRGADGMNPQSPYYQNTNEAKANPYPDLPDPLTLKN